jgi:hypothetical protein
MIFLKSRTPPGVENLNKAIYMIAQSQDAHALGHATHFEAVGKGQNAIEIVAQI